MDGGGPVSVKRQNDNRWIVETRRDVFDDVGADKVEVTYGGALLFSSGHPFEREPVVIYAPGQWLTVAPEEDA